MPGLAAKKPLASNRHFHRCSISVTGYDCGALKKRGTAIAEYKLKDGTVLTDEEIDRLCGRYERGDYSEFEGGETVYALVAFTDDDGNDVEGIVCAVGEEGRTVSVEDGEGSVHDGIPGSALRIVQSVWERAELDARLGDA